MAFDPIHYTYVPTAPRPKSTKPGHKNTQTQVGILNENQHIKPTAVALDTPRPSVAATAGNSGDDWSTIRGTFCDLDYLAVAMGERSLPTVVKQNGPVSDIV